MLPPRLALAALPALCLGCAPEPPPPALPMALPPPVSAGVIAGLALPARVGLIRVSAGRVTPVPASEQVRWRGALHEVNHRLPARIRLLPLPLPVEGAGLQAMIAGLIEIARLQGLDAVLIYELTVRAEDDPVAAGIAGIPLFGGIVPGTVMTEAQGRGLAILVDTQSRGPIGFTEARLQAAAVGTLKASGGEGANLQPMAEYAMLHALIPGAEDMLTEAAALRF
ncbi:hypothetical protein LNKW23_20130 [Paralimibaculum aggregatum]|uniref:DUF3313 domain-containing protein n=1 Tax=Paralimibaculum aggregatum TaxID=3036245 RepID=A0ABQ6LHP1_9RHOB|nr:hypothetical protein LNKW23_20130 [Limibaculum sp. NKW23]